MSRPPVPFDLTSEHLHIVGWPDPVVEAVGHDLRSAYVERFWLAVLGPSTGCLLRLLDRGLDANPDGFDLHLEDTAKELGLGMRGGPTGPFLRAFGRTAKFQIARPAGPGALAVRRRLQTLTRLQVDRLPATLQAEHAAWLAKATAEPTVEQRRTRARRLALSLLELGEPAEAAELQLHRWKIHPAMAHDAMRWATERLDPATMAAATGQPRRPTPPVRAPRPAFDPADDAA